jgi:hypothetical protein
MYLNLFKLDITNMGKDEFVNFKKDGLEDCDILFLQVKYTINIGSLQVTQR